MARSAYSRLLEVEMVRVRSIGGYVVALTGLLLACSSGTSVNGGGGGSGNASSTGGAKATGGASAGGAASCAIQECFRPVQCVLACGQDPVRVSCCPCTAPAFDSLKCPSGSGGSGAGGGGMSGGGTTSSGGSGANGTGGDGLCGGVACQPGEGCACGGPGISLQCACGRLCKLDADCPVNTQVCCNGVCTTPCTCYCD